MSNATMRAKMRIQQVKKNEYGGVLQDISLDLRAVGPNSAYPEDGSDENNTFARWTPSADLSMTISNPALFESFSVGDEFYVDFTKAEKEG